MASFQIDFELSSASGFWRNERKGGILRWCNGGNGSKVKRYEDEMVGEPVRADERVREERKQEEEGYGRVKNLRDFYWPRKCLPRRDKDVRTVVSSLIK